MAAQRRTKYQMTHRPAKVSENFCPNTKPALTDRGQCPTCDRFLSRRVAHRPHVDGAYGWTEHYADGSTRQLPPGFRY